MIDVVQNTIDGVLRQTIGMRSTAEGELPAAAITRRAVQAIFGSPLETLRPGAIGQTLTGSWQRAFVPGQWPARNVIAILPGSDPQLKNEYVVISNVGTRNG